MTTVAFVNANVVLPDGIGNRWSVLCRDGRIESVGADCTIPADAERLDVSGNYLCPGFVDIHVHGGGGADFMDLTDDAFRTVCQTHARHGTTSLTPTSTVASTLEYKRFLELCSRFREMSTGGARVVGCHLYGPYFLPAAKGCHPNAEFLTPHADDANAYREFDNSFPLTVTIAPELSGAEELTRACRKRGVRVNIGHSYATFEQVEAAVGWGATHVDHLFCAMSDRARLRQLQAFPMRAGVMEATLFFEELTTEVIADGKHLDDSLLRLAFKLKNGKLALVTDSMRAIDMPDGEYWFGPEGTGERVRKSHGVGVTLDGTALASAVMGMDHCIRTMMRATRAPAHEIIHMASLTPATIIGLERELGSIEVDKRADFAVMNSEWQVQAVYSGAEKIA